MTEYNRYSDIYSPGPLILATRYGSVETTISGTDYSFKDNTALFDPVSQAREVLLRPDADIQVKFNDASNNYFTMAGGDVLSFSNFVVSDIYVTVASGTADIKVLVMGI